MIFKDWIELKKQEMKTAERFVDQMSRAKVTWPSRIKTKADLKTAIHASQADDTEKDSLLEQLDQLWTNYETSKAQERRYGTGGSTGPSPGRAKPGDQANIATRLVSSLVTKPMVPALTGIALFLIVLIFFALFGNNQFLENLSDVEFARGLITFLFALGTIGISLIITFSVFASDRPMEESKERFYRGKEILTLLIGILGTIVGFYFGSPTDVNNEPSPMALSRIQFSISRPVMEAPLAVFGLASGGTPPYTYTLTILRGQQTLLNFQDQQSENGLIFKSFTPEKKASAYRIKPVLFVKDMTGQSMQITGESIPIEKPGT